MIIHWLFLGAGLAFGLVPPRLLMNCECRYLTFDDFWYKVIRPIKGESGRRRRWWKMPLVWIDPARGLAAAWMLSQAFEPALDADGVARHLPAVLGSILLMACIWAQTTGRLSERETLSPSGFMGGFVLGCLPPQVSLPALAMGLVASVAMHNYVIGYLAASFTVALTGVLFMGKSVAMLGVVASVALPVVVNFMRGSRMVMPVRC